MQRNPIRLTIATTIAIATGTLTLAPAALAADTGQHQATVVYADLDLATQAGLAELDRRIDRAARQVCGMDEIRTGTRLPSRSARKCFEQARQQIDERFASIRREASSVD